MIDQELEKKVDVHCTHCGDSCPKDHPIADGRDFCCVGCEKIYFLLKDNNLDQYYSLNETPGISGKKQQSKDFNYLDDPEVCEKILDFNQGGISRVHFRLPDIHCSSCLWLLENIHRLNDGILHSNVNFLEKKAYITFKPEKINLKDLVILLTRIGYEPELNFAKLSEGPVRDPDRSLLLKIGVAGFSFGNIMLLSFPEYLGFEKAFLHFHIGIINILLALPVFFYSGFSYLIGAWENIKAGKLGIHVPLALGILTLFLRSLYEISFGVGEGYFDSFTGFIMFLLIGKWFQNYTQESISFDRNYKSYFPISVLKKEGEEWKSNPIHKINTGDQILIKHGEIIPCDGFISKGNALIDYSFVTGESDPLEAKTGDQVFAGGKQQGAAVEITVSKQVDQSYLTQLWNEKVFREDKTHNATLFLNRVSTYFTMAILLVAAVTFWYWYPVDKGTAFKSITAVLIVACPCALALSVPFILGNATRILARYNFYAKNVETLESILDIDTIVFDKTGTLTRSDAIKVQYTGDALQQKQKELIASAAYQSNHPLSRAIYDFLKTDNRLDPDTFEEIEGAGIRFAGNGQHVKLGSAAFIKNEKKKTDFPSVFVEINGNIVGEFIFEHPIRENITEIIDGLNTYDLVLLSGDNEREKSKMKSLFPAEAQLKFNQNPKDKLEYIKKLQSQNRKVMMIGDGLNDAGALMQSNTGIVISDDNNSFSPACDVVLSGGSFKNFIAFLQYIRSLKGALYGALVIALMYNLIGLGFAVTGQLSPIVAAILMPVSSITIMIYGLLISRYLSHRLNG